MHRGKTLSAHGPRQQSLQKHWVTSRNATVWSLGEKQKPNQDGDNEIKNGCDQRIKICPII